MQILPSRLTSRIANFVTIGTFVGSFTVATKQLPAYLMALLLTPVPLGFVLVGALIVLLFLALFLWAVIQILEVMTQAEG